MISKKLSLAALGAILLPAAAFATSPEGSAAATVKTLPDQGDITISGTVSKVEDADSFTLTDSNGDTIKVDSAQPLELSQGDQVTVQGSVHKEMMGLSKGITAASVTKGAAEAAPAAGAAEAAPAAAGEHKEGEAHEGQY